MMALSGGKPPPNYSSSSSISLLAGMAPAKESSSLDPFKNPSLL
jgi:hypothetical protein